MAERLGQARRCRYARVVPITAGPIEHQRPAPLREVSWNAQRQSGEAHSFMRLQPSAGDITAFFAGLA